MSTFMPVAGTGGLDSLLAGLMGGTGTAGTAGTGAPAGLQGLFGALLGTGTPTGMDANALLASLTQGTGQVDADALKGLQDLLPLVQTLDLGNGVQLDLQGAGVDIAVLQQTITQLTVTLQTSGIDMSKLGSAKELAQALIVQGMDPEEAVAKATALESMLAMLKEKLQLKDGEETSAVAMLLLAGAMNPLPLQQAVTVTLRHETQSVQMVNVSLLASSSKAKGAYGDKGTDVLSQLLGGKEMDKKDAAKDAAQDLLAAAAPVETAPATDTSAAVPVVETKTQPHLDNTIDVNAVQAQVVSVAPKRAVQDVAKEDVIDPVEGETMFKMREGRDGALTVEATPAAGKMLEQQLNAQQQNAEPLLLRHGAKDGVAVPVQSAWPFADQVAAAARARVSDQAVVQIKSLVGEGGGTVRMILNPPELGEVRIELVIKNGEVTGTLAASDVAVVHELSRDLAGLKQAFADAGLKLGQDGLNVALNQQQGQGFGQGQQGQNAQQAHQQNGFGTGDASTEGTADVADVAARSRWVSPDSLVDVEI